VRVEVICVLLYVCIDDDVMSGSITASWSLHGYSSSLKSGKLACYQMALFCNPKKAIKAILQCEL
jgi:hypothetical protein